MKIYAECNDQELSIVIGTQLYKGDYSRIYKIEEIENGDKTLKDKLAIKIYRENSNNSNIEQTIINSYYGKIITWPYQI